MRPPDAADSRAAPLGGASLAHNCAVYYVPEAYEGDKALVVGRQSAGAGFLEALTRHAGVDTLYCFCAAPQHFDEFRHRVDGIGGNAPACVWIRPDNLPEIAAAGCLFQPGPIIAETAWLRRFWDERLFSICGITHSVATERVIRGIRDFITAPTQPWDALICTSQAARSASEGILDAWRDYLAGRNIAVPAMPLRHAVIPLGVHLDRFERTAAALARGQALRAKLGLEQEAVVGLYFGRLNFLSKAHPTPIFRAFELAQRRLSVETLHLLLVGQFTDPRSAAEFDVARRLFCPSVVVHWINGTDSEAAHDSWFAADFFISLPDNVQESFGLTPVEAMAASLPCVVSDWNGYKETVVEGETGFRVPTLMAPPGTGIDFADDHARHVYDHFAFIGMVAQNTAVDIDSCARAIAMLASDPALRRRMGEAGRRRAETLYDWRVVIRQYQELWRELADVRARAEVVGARDRSRQTVHPDYPDPFALFRAHPTHILAGHCEVRLADLDGRFVLKQLRHNPMHMFPAATLLGEAEIAALVERLEQGPRSVTQLVADLQATDAARAMRTILWLYKYGIVSVEPPA